MMKLYHNKTRVYIEFLFLLIPHFEPAIFNGFSLYDSFFNAWKIVSGVCILALFLLRRIKPNRLISLFILLYLWILFSTIYNGSSVNSALINIASSMSILLLFELYDNKFMEVITASFWYFFVIVSINAIFVVVTFFEHKNFEGVFFLGNRNTFILFVLPALCFSFLYLSQKNKEKKCAIFLIIECIFTILLSWSATSVVGIISFFLMYYTFAKYGNEKTGKGLFAISLVFDLFVTLIQRYDFSNLSVWFIQSFLDRNLTLTNRIYVWDAFIKMFVKSPFIGYGYGQRIVTPLGSVLNHTHNEYFQQLLDGGIPALIIFLIINYIVVCKVSSCVSSKCSRVFLSALACLFIIYIPETYSVFAKLNIMYILIYKIDVIANKLE